jgi:TRAP-type C4-dicarboxylate transport system substrate-binding protein
MRRGTFQAGAFTAALACALVTLLGGIPSPGTAEAEPGKPIRLRLGSIAPEGSPWAEALLDIKRRIEDKSAGRIKVTLFLNGRRGDEQEMLTELLRDQLQGAGLSNGILATVVPAFQVLELPFLLRTPAEADHVVDEVIGPELEHRALAKGLYVGLWSENGWRSIATRSRPVRSATHCDGIKVRSQESTVNFAFWESVGAKPVRIPLDEVLPALEAGVVEGYDQTPVYSVAAGWYTQIRYFTLTQHIYQPAVLVYSRRFIESLPQDLRSIVLSERADVTARTRLSVRKANDELVSFLSDQGVEVIRPTEEVIASFVESSAAVYGDLRDSIGGEVIDRVRDALTAFRASREDRDE